MTHLLLSSASLAFKAVGYVTTCALTYDVMINATSKAYGLYVYHVFQGVMRKR